MSERSNPARPARTRSIGTTLVGLLIVPLLALVGLWGFVASTTISRAASEYDLNRVGLGLYKSTEVLLLAFEKERATTFIWQSSPQSLPLSQLTGVRGASDVAIAAFQKSGDVSARLQQATAGQLSSIPGIRTAVNAGNLSPAAAFQQYSTVINEVLTVFITPAQPDTTIYERSLASLDVARTQEQLSRAMVLVEGVEVDHTSLNAADRLVFAGAAANQEVELQDAIALSSGPSLASLLHLASSSSYAQLTALENQIGGAVSQSALADALSAWGPVAKTEYGQLQAIENAIKVPLINASGQLGRTLVLQAGLSGGLGLIALLVSVFLMIRFGRRVRGELTSLREGAQAMASERLPRVIKELRDGEEVDVAAESPPLATGKITEVARVAEAFSSVQRTAIDAAVGQANLRKGVGQVFLNLSLRNQSLLHRQLSMLDTLERTTDDPSALADLFRLDHLTTRMRRNAESLIILSGSTPGRGWRDPVPVLDVLRAAIAEVEDYVRADVVGESSDSVVGIAVNDVVHLIAELVENATAFSPPNTHVHLRAQAVGFGVAVEVEDRGLGPAQEELDAINARLASPPGFELPGSGQLGMFVVGQLAARHGIRVSLRPSPYGGTTAIVLLPHSVIVPSDDSESPESGTSAQRQPARASGIPRPADATDPNPSWTAELAVSSPGRHRLDATSPVRGLWEPPAGQESARLAPPLEGSAPVPAASNGTHLGLPLRVRQANLAPQLRKQEPDTADPTLAPAPAPAAADEPTGRSPEETLSMMSAFQDGWQRGRAEDLDELDAIPDTEQAHEDEAAR